MGENKGHGVKGPRHDDDVDELGMNTASGRPAPGRQQQSGGTPALDDLGSRQGESAKDASQAWSQDNSIDKGRGNR